MKLTAAAAPSFPVRQPGDVYPTGPVPVVLGFGTYDPTPFSVRPFEPPAGGELKGEVSAALGSCQTNPPPAQGRWGEAVLYGSSNIESRIVGKPPTAKWLTGQQNSLDTDSIASQPAPEAKFQVSRWENPDLPSTR